MYYVTPYDRYRSKYTYGQLTVYVLPTCYVIQGEPSGAFMFHVR